jgi:hypothetical protein
MYVNGGLSAPARGGAEVVEAIDRREDRVREREDLAPAHAQLRA